MKAKKTYFIFIAFILIGIILLIAGSIMNVAGEDLFYVDMKNDFKFENNKKYFIDSSHIEIIGDYFYSKSVSNKKRSTNYYYNAKVTNSYNQEYYVIMVLNDGARTNMLNGDLVNLSGVVHEVNSEIKDKQLQSLANNGISENVYNVYFEIPTNTLIQLVGVSLILTGLICSIIFIVQGKIRSKKESSSNT